MKREIKFRGWDCIRKQMVDWHDIVNIPGHAYDFLHGVDKNIIPMQFTGLFDKNGKELYEGDIISFYFSIDNILQDKKPIISTVTYKDDGFIVMESLGEVVHLIDAVKAWSKYTKGGLEIIGNIYENPNLLK